MERDVGPDGRVAGTRHGPWAEETRVGEMEGPWIVQYVGLSPMSWMGVDDVDLGVNPARSGRNRKISSTAPLTGSKGRLGFRRRVKFTTEEARSYKPKVQNSKIGKLR